MKTLDLKQIQDSDQDSDYDWSGSIPTMQTAVYVMAGGGLLGRMAAEQPADFYIDARAGRLPYSRKEITQAVNVLVVLAKKYGFDPHHMPAMPQFHNLGIF